jgi:hypothetical protein
VPARDKASDSPAGPPPMGRSARDSGIVPVRRRDEGRSPVEDGLDMVGLVVEIRWTIGEWAQGNSSGEFNDR